MRREIWALLSSLNQSHHVLRVPVLPELSVDAADEADLVRVAQFRFGDELSDGAGGVEALGHRPRVPLRLGIALKVPGSHVQRQDVPGD